jgi:hypothetical protein
LKNDNDGPVFTELPNQIFEARKLSNQIILEHFKQVITVASASIVLTVSFLTGAGKLVVSSYQYPSLLVISWILLAGATFTAVYGIAQMPHRLDVPDETVGNSNFPKSFAGNIVGGGYRPMVIGGFLLFFGMLFLVIFGGTNLNYFVSNTKSSVGLISQMQATDIAKKAAFRDGIYVRDSKAKVVNSMDSNPYNALIWNIEFILPRSSKSTSGTPSTTAPITKLIRVNALDGSIM